jgi:hypothetical protein
LALWINQGTQWFSGELVETSRTRCSVRQSPLMTRLPRSPGSTLVLRLNQETIHDFISPFLPPCGPHLTLLATGSLEPSLLVFSHLDASSTMTFHACSSLAPTLVKPQSAPAILSQESVHTTLSITHHTWISIPLDECIDNTYMITKKKRKRKETTKRNSNKRSKAKRKAKSKIT